LAQPAKDHKLFIRAFHFITTYDDVATAGFISQMHGSSLHNRERRINHIIQTAMKTKIPAIEVKMVPMTLLFKHGLTAKKCVTHHVVSIQADR
jgi:hypothetical protein